MSAFEQIVDISGQAGFPATPQVVIPFEPRSLEILNEDITDGDAVFVSFDGKEDMGHILAGMSIRYQQRITKVWFRIDPATDSAPTNLQVVAES